MAIIGRRLVGVIAVKNAAEAQFRAVGSHLRERGTSTPLSEGQDKQHRLLSGSLNDVIARLA